MRAPLPPPARPPIRAPPPAPPPIMAALRLPLPLRYRLTELVFTSYASPFMVTESRASLRTAPPLKRPRGTALVSELSSDGNGLVEQPIDMQTKVSNEATMAK